MKFLDTPAVAFAKICLLVSAAAFGLSVAAAAAVPAVTYHRLDTVYTTGVAIRPDTPQVVGTVVIFQVAPALPAGLVLNAATGILSGTPTTPAASADYVVKAANFTDSVLVTLRIGVVSLAPPSGFHYPLDSVQFVNVPLKITPAVTGTVASYSVLPKLPAGLSLDTKTGIITGTPEAAGQGTYVVTAQNVSGLARDTLALKLRKPAWYRIAHSEGIIERIAGAVYYGVCFADAQRGAFVGGPGADAYEAVGVVATTNGGTNWTGGGDDYLESCDYAPDGSVGFAVGETGFNLDDVHTPIIRKIVPGTSTSTYTYLSAAKAGLVRVQMPGPTTGYILAGNGVLFKTLTGGARWDSLASGVPTGDLCFPTENTGYALGANGVIQKTVNGGLTWTPLATGLSGNYYDIEFTSADTGYAVGQNGMFAKTFDGGSTWLTLGTGTTAELYAVAFERGRSVGYAGGNGVLLRTTNGGQTWKAQETGLQGQYNGLSAPAPGVAYVSGNHDGYIPGGFLLRYLDAEQPTVPSDPCAGRLPGDSAAPGLTLPQNKATGTATTVTLNWNGSECADSYRTQVASDSVFGVFLRDTVVAGHALLQPALSHLTRYYWRVQARNVLGSGSWSATYSFTTETGTSALQSAQAGSDFGMSRETLHYALSRPGAVKIRLLDLAGRETWTFRAARQNAGRQSVVLPLKKMDRSLYLLDFETDGKHRVLHVLGGD